MSEVQSRDQSPEFVDTLEVIKSLDKDTHGGWFKLQCHGEDLCAHGVLDDCFALKVVYTSLAAVVGVSPWLLLQSPEPIVQS